MTAPTPPSAYADLIRLTKEASLLGSTASLLSWDQETVMPPGGVEHRSRQLAQLARLTHQMATDPRLGEALAACEADRELLADPRSVPAVNVRETRRLYDLRTKLPASLVEELARTTSLAHHEWIEARKASDYPRFRPWLAKVVELTRRKAECLGWKTGGEPWDALADTFEPGCTAQQVEAVFTPLRPRLGKLVAELMASPRQPGNRFNEVRVAPEAQMKFCRFVAERLGFDFNRGRLDTSAHPFCGGTHPHDVRMTTRFKDHDLGDALGSTMHESGHGMYEQGLPMRTGEPEDESGGHIGTPMCEAVSLAIHESQSRMWENQVGRSRPFWAWALPKLREFFGDAFGELRGPDEVYREANRVKPDLIRVEADEATYNLHVMVRFELERALVRGDLGVDDLPAAWNARYEEYLGIDVPDDRRGVLQDTHWSGGAIGYFPTYTLGNLYAAQFFEAALAAMPDLHDQFAAGEFGGLKRWLNEKIHGHGMRYRAAELCEVVTGKPLSADPLLRHLEGKLRPSYGV